nr:reverse transcriptase domain-containing protein [Tanacetum cinerariifolium]
MEELLQAPTDGVGDAIVVPLILANQFELKIGLLNLVTAIAFHGFKNDDPHSHIRRFTKITQTVKLNNVPSDVVKLLLFLFSLEGAARTWLEKEPPNSITTWNDLVSKFVNRFFPPSNLRNEITRFQQRFSEIFSEAWDRFKDLLNECPHHGFSPLHHIDTFYNSLSQSDRILLILQLMEVERDSKTIMDQVLTESTIRVPPPVVQSPHALRSFEIPLSIASSESPPSPISSSSELPNLAKALALMPKYRKMLKDLLFDKEKLLGLANTSVTENCSTVLLKMLPEKLGDPRKFLIPHDFPELEKCMALADLGARINLRPLSLWKSKFTFPADFVIFDYDVDPRVLLILRRPFLWTARALVDVYGEELILRDGDEKLIFHAESTSRHPHKHGNESINMINFIDIACEDCFDEVLKIQKSNHCLSGNPTPSDLVVESLFVSLIPYGDSDSQKSSGSTTTHSDYSLPDYDAFYFDDDHIEEKSTGSTTTHSDFSLPEYDSFIFDLSIDPLPPADTSVSHHEEFADGLAHIISPPENEDKVFNPMILTSKGFHSRHSLGLSHRDSEAFKINKKFKSPAEIFPFFCLYYGGEVSSLDAMYLHFYPP